jgi:monoamine oxidase
MAGWLAVQLGAEVTVFEAQEEVGGRVSSNVGVLASGRIIEQGGELVGIIHPYWLGFARTWGLGMSVITPDDDYAALGLDLPLVLNGQTISRRQLEEIYDGMSAAFDGMSAHARQVDPTQPWTAANAAAWDAMSMEEWLDGTGATPLVQAAIRAQIENNNSVPLSRQSYLSQLAQVAAGGFDSQGNALFWTEGETFRCETGNQSLAFTMASVIRDAGGTVLTGTPVSQVDVQDGGGAEVVSAAGTQSFDKVVLAIPQAAYGTLSITPALPDAYRVQVGPVVKFLSVVDGRFWIRESLSPSGMSDVLGETWEGTDVQMTVPGQQTELSVFAGGTAAQNALDHFRHDPGGMQAYYAPLIEQLFPGYTASIVHTEFVPWPTKPYIDGGYSCPGLGQVTGTVRLLNQVYQGCIAFAGEHTSPGFFGYMEGALESGVHAVLRLAGVSTTVGVDRLEGLHAAPAPVPAPVPAG